MSSRVRTLLAGAGLAGYIRSGSIPLRILQSYENYRRRVPGLQPLTDAEYALPKWQFVKLLAERMPTPTTLWIWRVPRGARGRDNAYYSMCINYGCWPHPKPKKAKPVVIGRGGLNRPHPPDEEEEHVSNVHPSYQRFEARMVAGLKRRPPNVENVERALPWNVAPDVNLFQQARDAFARVVMPVQAQAPQPIAGLHANGPIEVDGHGNVVWRFEP